MDFDILLYNIKLYPFGINRIIAEYAYTYTNLDLIYQKLSQEADIFLEQVKKIKGNEEFSQYFCRSLSPEYISEYKKNKELKYKNQLKLASILKDVNFYNRFNKYDDYSQHNILIYAVVFIIKRGNEVAWPSMIQDYLLNTIWKNHVQPISSLLHLNSYIKWERHNGIVLKFDEVVYKEDNRLDKYQTCKY